MRRAARIDANQSEIVEALRAAGAQVQSLAAVGRGVPDLLVGFRGRLFLFEVKQLGAALTPDEARWHGQWGDDMPLFVVRSAEDALQKLGAI